MALSNAKKWQKNLIQYAGMHFGH